MPLSGPVLNPDIFAPDGGPTFVPPGPSGAAVPSPVFSGQAAVGTQFFYSSTAVQTTVVSDAGSTLTVNAVTGFPVRFPYTLLLEWGTANQEVITVTRAPVGSGPYTFSNVLRGQDSTLQVTHSPGAQVNHGVAARDFSQIAPVFNVCSTQFAGGADPTGTVDSSRAIQAAVNAAIAAGGKTVYIPAGNYLLASTVTAAVPPGASTILFRGDGYQATILYSQVGGDAIRMYAPTPWTAAINSTFLAQRSGIFDLTIDGTFAGTNSAGLHIGDLQTLKLDLAIRNFSQTGSIGLHLDNTVNWTEEADIRVSLFNNTSNVVFDVTTGWDSFGYGVYDFSINANAGQEGVALRNGAQVYHSEFRIRGDFGGSSTPITAFPGTNGGTGNNAVLRLTGAAPAGSPNAGNSSALFDAHIQVMVENTIANTFNPYTIYIDSGCFLTYSYGILDFTGGGNAFTPSNITVLTNPNPFQFVAFVGNIAGDTHLNPGVTGTHNGPVGYTRAAIPVFTGTAFPQVNNGDFFSITLTANTIITPNYSGSGGGQIGAQRKTIIVTQAAAGGPYTVTWPTNGSPTTTNPNVAWAGGAPPVMSPTANAVDVYLLETPDGASWYGYALQAQGSIEPYTQVLTPTYTSANSGAVQNVTGMAVILQPGKYLLRGRFWYAGAGVIGSTQTFAWTFGGTATSALVSWQFNTAAYVAPVSGTTITTSTGASPTITATTYPLDFEAHVVVSVAGTLQLTNTNTTAADEVSIFAGSYLVVTPAAA